MAMVGVVGVVGISLLRGHCGRPSLALDSIGELEPNPVLCSREGQRARGLGACGEPAALAQLRQQRRMGESEPGISQKFAVSDIRRRDLALLAANACPHRG